MNQKGFVKDVVIIVLAILLLGGGYFYFSKKPAYVPAENTNQNQKVADETADWKIHTYKNGENSYSFKYPNDWVIVDESGNSPTIGLENKNAKNFDTTGYGLGLTIPTITIEDLAFYHKNSTTGVDSNGSYASIDNFIQMIKKSNNDKIFEERNITIAGNIFKRILRGYPDAQTYEYLINYPNSPLFVVTSTPVLNTELNNSEKVNNIEITEKILSTFKFTK